MKGITMIRTVNENLKGEKTYILVAIAILAVILAGTTDIAWLDANLNQILTVLGFGSVAALRAGVNKVKA
jgi:hypothetical protein